MTTFVSIILLAFCILQIILFFKVWRMTNNVKKIKEELLKKDFPAKYILENPDLVKNTFNTNIREINKLLYLGDNVEARRMLLSMKYDLEDCCKSADKYVEKEVQKLAEPLLSKIEEYLEKL